MLEPKKPVKPINKPPKTEEKPEIIEFNPGEVAVAFFDGTKSKKPVLIIEKSQQYYLIKTLDGWNFWIWERKLSRT